MNLATGECKEEQLDDLNTEFCLPDTLLYGEKTRFSYHQYLPADMHTVEFRALVKYDHEDGSCVRYDYPDGWFASESPYARRVGAQSEDDGYVVTIMMNTRRPLRSLGLRRPANRARLRGACALALARSRPAFTRSGSRANASGPRPEPAEL